MRELLHDFRIALRVLAKSPSFTIVATLTLAVAIGATTAIFSVVNGVLLQPLPYPDPDDVVTVVLDATPGGVPEMPFSPRGYWHFFNNNRSFVAFGGYSSQDIPLVGEGGEPIQVTAGVMSRSAFEALGVAPFRGRFPSAEEDAPGGALVALVSYDLWRTRFGADDSIIGKTIDLNGTKREVIGIMRNGYDFPSPTVSVWLPFQLDPASPNFGAHGISAIARLAKGASLTAAVADAEALIKRFPDAGYTPEWMQHVFTGRAYVRSYREQLVGDVRQTLIVLLGTAGFVLLIACSNVANLFLLRAEGRTRETAVRMALGAGRARVVRYVVVESLVLAAIGGIAGILLAFLGTKLLVSIGPATIPRLHETGITPNVLLFCLTISLVSGLLFGVLPALRSFSPRMVTALRDGGRGSTVGRDRHAARKILVVTQVAMALLLLVGSGLMVRSFQQLRAVNPGFSADGLLTFQLSPPPSRYPTPVQTAQFYHQLLGRLRALPGVQAAGGITGLPLSGRGAYLATTIEDAPIGPGEVPPAFHVRRVTPGYFEALRIPVVEGRTFEDRDDQSRLGSAIISQAVKQKYWPERSPIGRRIAPSSAPAAIVGVVGEVHQASLAESAEPTIYMPMLDSVGGGVRTMSVVVRTSGDPQGLIASVRNQIRELDPELPITNVRTMDTIISRSMSRTSFAALLLVIAAGVGLFLGAVGIYGVISYTVTQRTLEFGIRQALGAKASAIRTMVLRQGVALTVVGIVVGLIAALAMGKVMTTLLYGVSAFDPVTFAGGSLVFLAMAVLACLVPARRASRIPPSEALKGD